MKNSDLQKNTYEGNINPDEIAKIEAFKESPNIRIEKLNKLLEDLEGKKVLNVGCGNGKFLNKDFLIKNSVTGVDISLSALEEAKEYYHIPLQADIDSGIPVKDGDMDIVIASEVIEHIVDTDFFLCEVNRILKPGGVLVLTTPNINTPLSYMMMLFLDMPPYRCARYRAPHVRDFTKRTLRLALENNGFEIETYYGTAIFIPWLGYFMSGLCNFFPRLGSELVVKAIKVKNIEYRKSDFSLLLAK